MLEEMCIKCDAATGRAGKQDDSLYLDDGSGPYCDACFEAAQHGVQPTAFGVGMRARLAHFFIFLGCRLSKFGGRVTLAVRREAQNE